jgi:hypothetical protein
MNADFEVLQPEIKRGCSSCGITGEDIQGHYVVVSPTGIAHQGAEYGETLCGKDATGDKWWWPL